MALAALQEYLELTKALREFYANDSDTLFRIINEQFTPEELALYARTAGYDVWADSDGVIHGMSVPFTVFKVPGSTTATAIKVNSNLQTGTAAAANTARVSVPTTTTVTDAGKVTVEAGKFSKFTNGVKGVLSHPVAGKVGPALAAASAGITLGKAIDGTIYHLGEAFGLNPPDELDPSTWGSITQDMSDSGLEGLEKFAFNLVFGIDDDGNTQAYMDENALAYWARYAQQEGWFGDSELISGSTSQIGSYPVPVGMSRNIANFTRREYQSGGASHHLYFDGMFAQGAASGAFWRTQDDEAPSMQMYWGNYISSDSPQRIDSIAVLVSGTASKLGTSGIDSSGELVWQRGFATSVNPIKGRFNNETVTYWYESLLASHAGGPYTSSVPIITYDDHSNDNYRAAIAYYLLHGVVDKLSNVDGVSTIDGATTPDLSSATTNDEALETLKNTYPDLWNNRVENTVVQPDGTTKTITYVPVGFPTGGEGTSPTTTGASQTDTQVKPSTATDSTLATLIKTITDSLSKPQEQTQTQPQTLNPSTNPPDTGTGDTPEVPTPTGQASSLYAIYNPTLAQLNSFGAWLWSSDFIDQIKKLFNDPMQAIIGLHKVYAKPTDGAAQNIKVGYLDSGVSSLTVADQYATVDCGSVDLSEYFGNVLDYAPYTQVSLYLPFIGIVSLDDADVMRSSLDVVYHVDVLTGACLAEVKVTRDAAGGTLYQYAGNASVTLPISSGSYIGVLANVAGIASSIVGGFASGGALGAAAGGVIGAVSHAGGARVEHSGSFSGNAGAMGAKIPYLIISRPQARLAEDYASYIGKPANHTTTLGACSGYVSATECHLEGIPATRAELDQIESFLKGGVLI